MTNIKTESQLARTELELQALDRAYSMVRYLGFSPKHDSWKSYCYRLNKKIAEEIEVSEYFANKK